MSLSTMEPPTTSRSRRLPKPTRRRRRRNWSALLWLLPALTAYATFVLFPLTQTARYSLYDWDGFGEASPVGLENYRRLFTEPELLGSILHAFVLIVFFTVLPVGLGLVAAATLRELRAGVTSTAARVLLFVPQVIPLVGAGIAWTWMYSSEGLINELLRLLGLGSLTRAWLGDFGTALPAVGLIGTWVALGFCTVMLLAGIGRIDPSLYEAARLDGAGRIREFVVITVPGLRAQICVCITLTVISALASFDIVYVSTQGGPGRQTSVPGVDIYRLTFLDQQVGLACALAMLLAVLVLAVIVPIQRIGREE